MSTSSNSPAVPPGPSRTLLGKLLRFGGVSGLSFALNVGGFWLLHDLLGVSGNVSYALSLLLVFVVNFYLFRHWVFAGGASRPAGRQVLDYLVAAVSFRLSEFGVFCLLDPRLEVPSVVIVIGISIVATIAKFGVFNGRVFRDAGEVAPAARRRRRAVPLIAAALAVASCANFFAFELLREWAFEFDAAQHAAWAQRAWGAHLLDLDPIARFYAETASPPGWSWIVRGLARLGDLQTPLEIGAAVVFLATCFLLYRLGRAVAPGDRGRWAGLLLVASLCPLAWLTGFVPTILLQRSFAAPLTAALMLALHRRNMPLLGGCFVVAGLIYPIFVAGGGLAAFTYELICLVRDRRLPRQWYLAVLGGIVGLALVFVLKDAPDAYGDTVTAAQARAMSIFGPIGRNAIWVEPPAEFWIVHHRTGLGVSPLVAGVGLASAILAVALAGVRRVPMVAWVMLATSLALFAAAHATLFALYLPNRHVAHTVPLAWALIIASTLPHLGVRGMAMLPKRQRRLQQGATIGLACLATLAHAAFALTHLRDRGERSSTQTTFAYARTLPPDTMFAGMIGERTTDALSFRTGRPTLANRETLLGYYPDYYRDVLLPRVRASIDLYYATSWGEVDRIARENGVQVYLWIGDSLQHLPREEPMRSIARDALERGGGELPVMYEPPADRILWWRGNLRLIRVGDGPAAQGVLPGPVEPFPDLPDVDPLDALRGGDSAR